jgi:hypothetical protein
MDMAQGQGVSVTGGCQCGAVRYRLSAVPTRTSLCHCRMCQKASGNYFQAFTGVERGQFTWTRGSPGTFRSSELIERDFCRDCGTPLTYRPADADRVSVTIGSLDDPGQVQAECQYGMESKVVDLAALAGLPSLTTEQWSTPERLAKLASRQHPDHE